MAQNSSKYQQLHNRGVMLPDREIDLIVNTLEEGAKEALRWLGRPDADWPTFISSDNLQTIGYVPDQQVINIPIPYFQEVFQILSKHPLEQYQQVLYTIEELNLRKSARANASKNCIIRQEGRR